jgi:hypothetical protein
MKSASRQAIQGNWPLCRIEGASLNFQSRLILMICRSVPSAEALVHAHAIRRRLKRSFFIDDQIMDYRMASGYYNPGDSDLTHTGNFLFSSSFMNSGAVFSYSRNQAMTLNPNQVVYGNFKLRTPAHIESASSRSRRDPI